MTATDRVQRPIALSLKQPWLFAIFFCGKDIENRSWRSSRRGRPGARPPALSLAAAPAKARLPRLHASKTMDEAGLQYLMEAGFEVPGELPMGAYVGEVTITGCLPVASCGSRWAFGPWCYTLEQPVPYATPIPGRGQLGFYPVPDDVARMLARSRHGRTPGGDGRSHLSPRHANLFCHSLHPAM